MWLYIFCLLQVQAPPQPTGSAPGSPSADWHREFVTEADAEILEHSGKIMLLFEVLRMAEEVEDKVYVSGLSVQLSLWFFSVTWKCLEPSQWQSSFREGLSLVRRLVFSQSLISLDLIEDFLELSCRAKDEDKISPYKGNSSLRFLLSSVSFF